MNLDFDFSDSPLTIMRLSEKNLSIFVHEYVHFIQDISSLMGLNNAYVYSEYIHGLVTMLKKERPGKFNVPLKVNGNKWNLELNTFVKEKTLGSTDIYNTIFPTKIEWRSEKVKYTNKDVDKLELVIIKATNSNIVFGGYAIMESMAYLIERQITCGSASVPDYPYNSAEMVAKMVYPKFVSNPLNIIALCDMSMQYSNPGKIFVQTLNVFRDNNFLPLRPEEIIDYFYSVPMQQSGKTVSLEYGILSFGMMLGDLFKSYLKGTQFGYFHSVVYKLLGFGMNKRLNNRYFMLNLAKGGYAKNNSVFLGMLKDVGSPVICDKSNSYWLIPPLGINLYNYGIEYFHTIIDIYKILKEGATCCEMYEWCEKSPQTDEDDRCILNPWDRCSDLKLCPFATLWKHWGLEGYVPKY